MSQVRVGNTVFEDGKKLIAEFVHGAWYFRKQGRNGVEHEIFPPQNQAHFNSLPDALTLDLSDGELAILNEVKEVLTPGRRPRLSEAEFNEVMEAIETGVRDGLKKYGPYDPATDKRALSTKIRRAARNIVIYAAMSALRPGAERTLLAIIMRQAAWIFVRV